MGITQHPLPYRANATGRLQRTGGSLALHTREAQEEGVTAKVPQEQPAHAIGHRRRLACEVTR